MYDLAILYRETLTGATGFRSSLEIDTQKVLGRVAEAKYN
jgi:hypothetical protein